MEADFAEQILFTSNLYCFAHLRSSITDECTPKSATFVCNKQSQIIIEVSQHTI